MKFFTTKHTKITKIIALKSAEGVIKEKFAVKYKSVLLRTNVRIFLLFFVTFVCFVVQKTAYACTCPEMTEDRSLSVIQKAELIFEGTVVEYEERAQPEENFDYTAPLPIADHPFYARTRLKVRDLYKGTAQKGDRFDAYVDVMTTCGHMLQLGDITTFTLNRLDDVLVQADICSAPLPQHWEELQAGKFRQ